MNFVWSETSKWVQLLKTDVLSFAPKLDTVIMHDENQRMKEINIPFIYHLNEGAKEFFRKRMSDRDFDAGKLSDAPNFKQLL